MNLATISYLVREYDEAIQWFQSTLGFSLVKDIEMGSGKRWVLVDAGRCHLLLAKAEGPQQIAAIGKAAGGRVAFFLQVDNFSNTHAQLLAMGVKFREAPRHEPYGTVAVFEDLYGNGWDLIEPTPKV